MRFGSKQTVSMDCSGTRPLFDPKSLNPKFHAILKVRGKYRLRPLLETNCVPTKDVSVTKTEWWNPVSSSSATFHDALIACTHRQWVVQYGFARTNAIISSSSVKYTTPNANWLSFAMPFCCSVVCWGFCSPSLRDKVVRLILSRDKRRIKLKMLNSKVVLPYTAMKLCFLELYVVVHRSLLPSLVGLKAQKKNGSIVISWLAIFQNDKKKLCTQRTAEKKRLS